MIPRPCTFLEHTPTHRNRAKRTATHPSACANGRTAAGTPAVRSANRSLAHGLCQRTHTNAHQRASKPTHVRTNNERRGRMSRHHPRRRPSGHALSRTTQSGDTPPATRTVRTHLAMLPRDPCVRSEASSPNRFADRSRATGAKRTRTALDASRCAIRAQARRERINPNARPHSVRIELVREPERVKERPRAHPAPLRQPPQLAHAIRRCEPKTSAEDPPRERTHTLFSGHATNRTRTKS